MMDVRYKRDLNSNYMIMTDAEKREEIYEDRMITENLWIPSMCGTEEGKADRVFL